MRLAWALIPLLLVPLGCDALLVDPEPADTASLIRLTFDNHTPSDSSLLAAAMRNVEVGHFRFIHGESVRDTTVLVRRHDGETRVRLRLHPEEAKGWLQVEVELGLTGRQIMFEGRSLLRGVGVTPSPRINVSAVPRYVSILTGPSFLPTLGEPHPLDVQVYFVSGDPMVADVEWSTDDPDILEVVPGPNMVARGNGRAILSASAGDRTATKVILVRQEPARLTGVAPADTTIRVGESFRLRPFGEDANGHPLLPGAAVDWSAAGSVEVDPEGRVTGVVTGSGQVEGSIESGGADYATTITVLSPE